MTILYIGKSAETYQQCAENKDCNLIAVTNSIECLQLLERKNEIDVIVCSYHLPGNTGLYLFDVLNNKALLNNKPFILVSDEYNSSLFEEAFAKGIKDYFVASSTPVSQIIERAQSLHKLKILSTAEAEPSVAQENYRLPISKRIFDILFASSVLIFIAPVMLIIMLAIRLESKGKVYYISKRVGRKTFDFYKLRSMRSGSDALIKELAQDNNQYSKAKAIPTIDFDAPCPKCSQLPAGNSCSPELHFDGKAICDYWYNTQKNEIEKMNSTFIKIANDPRITRIGKLIRNTSIDELPQLINVIKGDMSIVGNRPLPVYEAELLTKDTMSKRFLAPAGITGLWQVELRGRGGEMSEEERMRLDNEYADHFTGNNYSFWYDIKLILRTFPGLIQKSTV
ncbi:sugar transferase [Flavobacterium sp. CYK-4]|uniref:sugar transferase n=1 Tax=Flavobacterium lotistagni TaxID=2709660 RepID=UPI00140C9831|nr:sugar transferase [Flavobacterium lotistagni]NHM07408.1 sugar transferase [Flavobacterium lotistagni]